MSLQEQADKLRQMNLFNEARDCYDKDYLPFINTYSLVDSFNWIATGATSTVDWGSISVYIAEHRTLKDPYTADEVLEAFYPKELYPEKHI